MNCEFCDKNHEGNYGSGRFCSNKCARAFSTKLKRTEINKIVSIKLSGRIVSKSSLFKNGHKFSFSYKNASKEKQALISKKISDKLTIDVFKIEFNSLSKKLKYKRVKLEQNNRCLKCNINTWNNTKIVLEIDHIDGNKLNNSRDNLRALCPNCHSQTYTWRKKKSALMDKHMVKLPDLDSGDIVGSNPT